MKLLILTAFYPVPGGTHERMFVHIRNKYYQEHGADVTVLNFDEQEDYEIDGIKVISLNTYVNSDEHYDIAVCHSANVRNHYRFLKKYESRFKHLVFFFHGHEMLYLTKDYPKPYDFTAESKLVHRIVQHSYDKIKIKLWRNYYKRLAHKSEFVFVSKWIYKRFLKNTGMTPSQLGDHCHIINNSIGAVFETNSYDLFSPKKYDYITIRSNLDGSKYCIDIFARLAKENPESKFLVIGKGRFFNHTPKPDNVEWIDRTLDHKEIIEYLNWSKCGLLLTREDTQGVMTCELVAFGMPVITSDIDVCHEIFDGMINVAMISNEDENIPLKEIYENLVGRMPYPKNNRYFANQTIEKEICLYKRLIMQ